MDGRRVKNIESLPAYKDALARGRTPIAEEEDLSDMDRDNEYTMLALRLNEGISLKAPLPSGESFEAVHKEAVEKNMKSGLLSVVGDRLVLTEKGRDLANRVELDFFRL